jgi:hypothetical protein
MNDLSEDHLRAYGGKDRQQLKDYYEAEDVNTS